jgi:NAD(P)-dependent dehydrogenase (short-subunit alcohol dehydrogenase family)
MSLLARFHKKVAIVTGAASGMGQATAIRLIAEGAAVIGVDTNQEGLAETLAKATKVCANNGRIRVINGSITDESDVSRIVADVIATEGQLDVLINMAGILRSSPTTETTLEQFQAVLNVNLIGTFLFCREALPHLIKTKGNIVNAASTSAQFGHPYMAAYAASKGGVFALTRTLAWEYMKQGVRVNAVAPGGIQTPMVTNFSEQLIQQVPNADFSLFGHLQRIDGNLGQADQVASVVAMLASADGGFMTGEILKVDGGVHN